MADDGDAQTIAGANKDGRVHSREVAEIQRAQQQYKSTQICIAEHAVPRLLHKVNTPVSNVHSRELSHFFPRQRRLFLCT